MRVATVISVYERETEVKLHYYYQLHVDYNWHFELEQKKLIASAMQGRNKQPTSMIKQMFETE